MVWVKAILLYEITDINKGSRQEVRGGLQGISDASFGYLRQMIEYKAKLRNCIVVIANRFFPSSKICSCCGKIKENLHL